MTTIDVISPLETANVMIDDERDPSLHLHHHGGRFLAYDGHKSIDAIVPPMRIASIGVGPWRPGLV